MKSSKVSRRWRRANKKYTVKRRWRVIWYVERDMALHRQKRYRSNEIQIVRMVRGRLLAADAWGAFWFLYYMPHVVDGPELWRGDKLVMRARRRESEA
jgi:hypothetical protein